MTTSIHHRRKRSRKSEYARPANGNKIAWALLLLLALIVLIIRGFNL